MRPEDPNTAMVFIHNAEDEEDIEWPTLETPRTNEDDGLKATAVEARSAEIVTNSFIFPISIYVKPKKNSSTYS